MDTSESSIPTRLVVPLTVTIPHHLRDTLMQRAVLHYTSASAIVETALGVFLRGVGGIESAGDRHARHAMIRHARNKAIQVARRIKQAQQQVPASIGRHRKLYLIVADDTEYVKIGYSVDPAQRLNNLQGSNMYVLRLVYSLPVSNAPRLERHIHHILRGFKIQGEWFRLPAPMLDLMIGENYF